MKARYELKIKSTDQTKIEQILNESDKFFIDLERRYPELKVST